MCIRDRVRFQKVAPLTLEDGFMIEPDAEDTLGAWKSVTGKWRVHTQLEDALEQRSSTRLGARPLEAVRSPNFYCLVGSGRNGIVVTGHAFQADYVVSASMQTRPGQMGLVFYY